MPQPTIDEAALKQLTDLAHALYVAIDTGDRAQILSAQQALSAKTEIAWKHIDQEQLSGRDKAVARLLADMAIEALPQSIQDPANYPRIQHELRLLKNSLVLLK
jgi:hypothetical protein